MLPRTKSNTTKAKKKRQQEPTDSEEEWDAKPRRKKPKKKKEVFKGEDMNIIHSLEPYIAKYESMCNTYKGYCKVLALARVERSRDLRAAREREESEAASNHIVKVEYMVPDMTSSLSSPSSPDTTSSSL
jgi:hypothetical protein